MVALLTAALPLSSVEADSRHLPGLALGLVDGHAGTIGVVVGQLSGAMEHCQAAVGLLMDPHLAPDVMTTAGIRWQLQLYALIGNAAVLADLPLSLKAEDVLYAGVQQRNKGSTRLPGFGLELLVEGR